MRFVSVCTEGGHLDDIPWQLWVHRHSQSAEQAECVTDKHLYLETTQGGSAGLGSMVVQCRACRARRTLGELAREKSLEADGLRCMGTQPWERREKDRRSDCRYPLVAVQRGSTSLHMPETEVALDIPETSSSRDDLKDIVRAHKYFDMVVNHEGPVRDVALVEITGDIDVSPEFVVALAEEDSGGKQISVRANLLSGEWAAFEKVLDEHERAPRTPDFDVVRSSFGLSDEMRPIGALVDGVGLVRRVREVMALTGFRRYKQEAPTRVDLGKNRTLDWYPAIERFGEGVFLKLNERRVAEWERNGAVRERVAIIAKRSLDQSDSRLVRPDLAPRDIMLHTLAHLLMRRLEFQSGYSSASLAERVYSFADDAAPQAGILIRATAGDKMGTLGGLVRLGEPDFFEDILLGAVEDADFCSSDPVCMEGSGQGLGSLNLAACHGCCLVSETSCELRNLFLDRVLLVGNGDVPGFFENVLEDARSVGRVD